MVTSTTSFSIFIIPQKYIRGGKRSVNTSTHTFTWHFYYFYLYSNDLKPTNSHTRIARLVNIGRIGSSTHRAALSNHMTSITWLLSNVQNGEWWEQSAAQRARKWWKWSRIEWLRRQLLLRPAEEIPQILGVDYYVLPQFWWVENAVSFTSSLERICTNVNKSRSWGPFLFDNWRYIHSFASYC